VRAVSSSAPSAQSKSPHQPALAAPVGLSTDHWCHLCLSG